MQHVRIHVTKSKRGHYTATARRKVDGTKTNSGALVARTTVKHPTKEAAKAELNETLQRMGIWNPIPAPEPIPGSAEVRQFDAFEIHPVVCWREPGDDKDTCEQCETWAEALNMAGEYSGKAFWTVYGHCTGDGLEAIADVDTEEAARVMLYKLTGIIATEGNQGPYMAKQPAIAPEFLKLVKDGVYSDKVIALHVRDAAQKAVS
jgi:hypothetical protein